MAIDKRRKDVDWNIHDDNGWNGAWSMQSYQGMHLAVLMDIRDELKKLNVLLHCENFISIPRKLKTISRNTAQAKRKAS